MGIYVVDANQEGFPPFVVASASGNIGLGQPTFLHTRAHTFRADYEWISSHHGLVFKLAATKANTSQAMGWAKASEQIPGQGEPRQQAT